MGHLNSRLIWHKYAEPYFKEGKEILEIVNITVYDASKNNTIRPQKFCLKTETKRTLCTFLKKCQNSII